MYKMKSKALRDPYMKQGGRKKIGKGYSQNPQDCEYSTQQKLQSLTSAAPVTNVTKKGIKN